MPKDRSIFWICLFSVFIDIWYTIHKKAILLLYKFFLMHYIAPISNRHLSIVHVWKLPSRCFLVIFVVVLLSNWCYYTTAFIIQIKTSAEITSLLPQYTSYFLVFHVVSYTHNPYISSFPDSFLFNYIIFNWNSWRM